MEHPKGCRHWGAPHTTECAPQWATPQPHPSPQPDPELVALHSRAQRPGPAVTFPQRTADSSRRERMLRNSQEQFSRTVGTTHHTYRPQGQPQVDTTQPTDQELRNAIDLRPKADTVALAARLGITL